MSLPARVGSGNGQRQIPGTDRPGRGRPARTGLGQNINRNNGRRGQPARRTHHVHHVHTERRRARNNVSFTVGVGGRRAGKVSVGVGILAGAILLGLGILFANPPMIAIGATILGVSLIITMIVGIQERHIESFEDLGV